MQQIVTPDYYKDVFCGEFDGDEKELSKLLEVAYIIIYNETCGRIAQFDSLDKKVQTAVKDAICWQVDYISANGGLSFVHDGSFSNISLGSFSYSAGGNSSVSDGNCRCAMCHTACFYRPGSCIKVLMRYDETYTTQSFDTHCRCCCRKDRQMGRNLRNVYGNIEICPYRTNRELYQR